MVDVYLVSESGERFCVLQSFETPQQAFDFCQDHGWFWEDEYGLPYALDFDGADEM